ncbi:MAG: hypothetical protein ACREJ6_05500 [Candidatus Methylomirabilis sp.]
MAGAGGQRVYDIKSRPALTDIDKPNLRGGLHSQRVSPQPPWAVKFAGSPDQDPNAFKTVPNMAGVRGVVLEVTDPRPAADLPQVGLAALARWQGRWPLQVTRAVWNQRALVATLTLYWR